MLEFLIATTFVLSTLIWGILFRNGRYVTLITVAIAVRLLMVYLTDVHQILPMGDIADYVPYFRGFAVEEVNGDLWSLLSDTGAAFYTLLYAGWLYNLTDNGSFWVIRVVNSMMSVWMLGPSVVLYEIIFKREPGYLVPLLILFWPPGLRFAMTVGRTIAGVFFTILGVASLAKAMFSKNGRNSIGLYLTIFLSVGVSVLIRPAHIAFFLPLFFLLFFSILRASRHSSSVRKVTNNIFAFLIGVVFIAGLLLAYNSIAKERQRADLNVIAERALVENDGGTAYLVGVYPSSAIDFLWYAPLHGLYFMYSPFPWHALNASTPLAWVSVFFSFLVLSGFIRVYRTRKIHVRGNSELKAVLFLIAVSACILGLGVKNGGSAERWRYPLTVISLIVIAGTLSSKRQYSHHIDEEFPVVASR